MYYFRDDNHLRKCIGIQHFSLILSEFSVKCRCDLFKIKIFLENSAMSLKISDQSRHVLTY